LDEDYPDIKSICVSSKSNESISQLYKIYSQPNKNLKSVNQFDKLSESEK
jgi:hypothetical protein